MVVFQADNPKIQTRKNKFKGSRKNNGDISVVWIAKNESKKLSDISFKLDTQ